VGPLAILLFCLPLVGAVLGNYEIRALYSWMVVLIPGAIIAVAGFSVRNALSVRTVMFVCIVVHGVYGLGQMLHRLGVVPSALWAPAVAWDVSTQSTHSDLYVLYGRSTGLFINANLFGLWSVFAIIFAGVFLNRSQRVLGVALGLAGVVASQSRTAWVIVALLAVVVVAGVAGRSRHARSAAIAGFWLIPAALVTSLFGLPQRLMEASGIERLRSGLGVLLGGSDADANLAERVDVWAQAEEFARHSAFPLGTLGPPQTYFGAAIDNQFVSFYLQGSLPLVCAFVLALCGPIVLMRRGVPYAGTLLVMSGGVTIASFTLTPLDEPAAVAAIWVALGIALMESNRGSDLPGHRQTTRLPVRARSVGERRGP
jgi:hypothetical protein